MIGDEVFLTGATGFIGGHVLDALLESGRPVRALVRTPGRLVSRPQLSEVVGDVTRAGELVGHMAGLSFPGALRRCLLRSPPPSDPR